MKHISRLLAVVVILLGIVGLVIGAVFIGLGITGNNDLKEAMRVEHVTLGIESVEIERQVIDSLAEARQAADIIREHRHGIAATYEDLLGGQRFDPTKPEQLTYAQALNLENYLYLAVVAFGLVHSFVASGTFMVVVGIALGTTGVLLLSFTRKAS